MSGEGYGQDHRIAVYIRHLERGAATHAAYGNLASEQAVATSKHADDLVTAMVERGEDGEQVDGTGAELAQLRVEVLELQASIHSVGLSICLVGLTIAGSLGQVVPQPPDLTPIQRPDA